MIKNNFQVPQNKVRFVSNAQFQTFETKWSSRGSSKPLFLEKMLEMALTIE